MRFAEGRQVVNAAEREAVAYVASRALFGVEIEVVLRIEASSIGSGSLEHRSGSWRRCSSQGSLDRASSGGAGSRSGVVPALGRILEQVDGADGKCLALDDGVVLPVGSVVPGTNVSV